MKSYGCSAVVLLMILAVSLAAPLPGLDLEEGSALPEQNEENETTEIIDRSPADTPDGTLQEFTKQLVGESFGYAPEAARGIGETPALTLPKVPRMASSSTGLVREIQEQLRQKDQSKESKPTETVLERLARLFPFSLPGSSGDRQARFTLPIPALLQQGSYIMSQLNERILDDIEQIRSFFLQRRLS